MESLHYKEIDYGSLVAVRERLKKHPPTAPLTILEFPDPRLRKPAQAIEQVTDEIRGIAEKMLTTMYAHAGVGLAATQVNIHKRLIVMDISDDRNHPVCLTNPEITERHGEVINQEGCLSVPGFYAQVKRAEQVKIAAMDLDGHAIEFVADGLLADCVQHEIDHLDGKLFIDHLSPLKRMKFVALARKQRKKAKQRVV